LEVLKKLGSLGLKLAKEKTRIRTKANPERRVIQGHASDPKCFFPGVAKEDS